MQNELELRTKRFALAVIELIGRLPKAKTNDVLGHQLLKSGTSIGANYREAARAQSRDDFIHKISICEKKAAETEYWLELLLESAVAASVSCSSLLNETRELLAIFVASGKTAKSRR
jgi:four helix bundle protein